MNKQETKTEIKRKQEINTIIKNNVEEIISKNDYSPLSLEQFAQLLSLTIEEVKPVIDELVNECKLFLKKKDKNHSEKYLNNNLARKYVGKISIKNEDYGFILGEEKDIYVSSYNFNSAMDKDIVLYSISYDSYDRYYDSTEAKVLKIIKRNYEYIVGEIYYTNGKWYLSTMDKNLKKNIVVTKLGEAKVGSIVRTKIIDYGYNLKVEVTDILGKNTDLGIDISQICASLGVLREFPEEVIEEVNALSIDNEALNRKCTYENELIFTIDGDDAKDLDDAVSIKKLDNGNYELGVYIADVSYYVKENSLVDNEALTRGTSIYLVDRVIPMLPVRLSNDLCSLNPNENKLVISCIMEVNDKGEVVESRINEGIIKTTKRLSYNKCNDVLENGLINYPDYKVCEPSLKLMSQLADILRSKRRRRGAIDFDVDEPLIITDEKGKAIDIVIKERKTSEKIIEEFMILANETVAEFITQFDLPFIYRIHDKPNSEKFQTLKSLVKKLGYSLKSIHPMELQKLLDDLNEKDAYLKTSVLRMMAKAVYSSENIGHFGLASTCYTHFTSPIRRYPDLIVHRLLREYIFKGQNNLTYEEAIAKAEKIASIAKSTSDSERLATDCEYKVIDMKKAEYMTKHIGEVYDGVITSIFKFGIFVTLANTVDGLISSEKLKKRNYTYLGEKNKNNNIYVNRQSSRALELGQKIKIKVIESNKKIGQVDFDLITNESGERKNGKNKGRRKK